MLNNISPIYTFPSFITPVQRHQSEIEELEREIRESLQDETEDGFNQLIISTEEKIRNLFELKNNLLDIVFMKKGIRKMRSGGWY